MPDSTSLPNSQAEAAIMALRAGAIDAACNYEKAGEEKAASFHRGSAFAYESAIRALRSAEQPKDTSSDLRERILDEIEDPDDCEHGHPSCAKCLYERRERLLREAADSLNRAEQAFDSPQKPVDITPVVILAFEDGYERGDLYDGPQPKNKKAIFAGLAAAFDAAGFKIKGLVDCCAPGSCRGCPGCLGALK